MQAGNTEAMPSFEDFDLNKDGVITRDEFDLVQRNSPTDLGKNLARMLAEEEKPSPRHVFMYAGALLLALFLLVPVWCSMQLIQDDVYLHFASKGFPLVLFVLILLALLWVVAPRCFGLEMGWPMCPCLPVVPGCCFPGCPSCPALPGCPVPGRLPSLEELFGELCPSCFPMNTSCFGLLCCPCRCLCCCCAPAEVAFDDFVSHPVETTRKVVRHFFTSLDFLLCIAVAVVLIYVWKNAGLNFFMDLPLLNLSLLDFIGDVLPNLTPPTITLRTPTYHDILFFFPNLFKSFFYWVASPTTTVILSCVGLFLLYLLLLSVFFKYSKQNHREGKSDMHIWSNLLVIWSSFVLAIGLILMLAAMPVIWDARKANIELFQTCETGDKTRDLYVASQALHTLRLHPRCATEDSVEDCAGYESTPYTKLLKYMETNFHCSGFCFDPHMLPGGPFGAAVPYERPIGAFANPVPPTLFSKANYLASCDGMAARDMNNFVNGSGQRVYHVGMLLIFISMGSLWLKLRGFFAPDDKEVEPTQEYGYGAYGATMT